ncbi:MAG: HAMP domain-containing protein [Methylobacter sp.]|nr:MAG: HAMP domain-containing protein [Methylobacter sp.]
MNRSLQARIVLFFSILFIGGQVLTFISVYWVSKDNVLRQLGQNLVYAEHIFNRLITERGKQMASETRILAADFGFLAAVNSNDRETVRSAVENLTLRIQGQRGFYIGLDKKVVADTAGHFEGNPFLFLDAIHIAEKDGQAVAFGLIEGELFELAVVPVLAPVPIGWVAIAVAVDRNLIEHFKSLSSTALEISIVERSVIGNRILASSLPDVQKQALSERISQDKIPMTQDSKLVELGMNVFLTKSQQLPTARTDQLILAFLQIDLAKAVHPYLILLYAALGLLGLGLVATLLGGILIARRITQPVRLLSEATQRISAGQFDQLIPVKQRDELGLFAENFNAMTSKLKNTLEELEEFNRTLERKVEQRTEQYKQANEELTQAMYRLKMAQSQLVQSEKMASLGQLVAGVAHELNTPIGSINANMPILGEYIAQTISVIDQLKRADLSELGAQSLEKMLEEIEFDFIKEDAQLLIAGVSNAAARVREIVLSLRNFSRLDEAEIKDVLLEEGLNNALSFLQHGFKARIEVIKDYRLNKPVSCYAGLINQVFVNLIINAEYAIKDQGIISVITRQEDDTAIVEIKDNGHGMSDDILQKIFDPFFTTKAIGSGTGLGLSIAYGIMKRHKGSISVSSVLGEGSNFTLKLPMHQKD